MDTSSLMSGEGKPPAASRSRPAPFLDSTTPSKPLKTPIIRGFSNWRDPTAPAEVLPLDPKSAGERLWLSVCLFGTTHWLTSELTADASAGEQRAVLRRGAAPRESLSRRASGHCRSTDLAASASSPAQEQERGPGAPAAWYIKRVFPFRNCNGMIGPAVSCGRSAAALPSYGSYV